MNDGLDTCGGDPCAAVRAAKQQGLDFRLHVIGFDGGLVEKEVDFSTSELVIGVTRNDELSDAIFRVRVADGGGEVAPGRTYTASGSNPTKLRLTSGTYDVSVKSVEISGAEEIELAIVTVEPGGSTEPSHEFRTGTLRVGAARGGELVDATLGIVSVATGNPVGQGRTYTQERSNTKTFVLEPGDYRVTVSEIRGQRRTIEVSVAAGETVERMVDPAGGE